MGIRMRWFKNFLLIPMICLTLVSIFAMVLVKQYYYSFVENDLNARLNMTTSIYEKYIFNESYDLDEGIKKIYKNYSLKKQLVEYQIIDIDKKPLYSSEGNEIDSKGIYKDFDEAMKDGRGKYIGRYITDERVMIISKQLFFNDRLIGIVRCITTLEKVNALIINVAQVIAVLDIIIIILITILGFLFSQSIIEPIKEISAISRSYAMGDFSKRIPKRYNDEIGELTDSINYMARELEKKDKIKNDFIASTTHELRTPLTAIKGWTETLIGSMDSKQELEIGLNIINDETQRLQSLVEDILDYSLLKSKEINLDIESVNIDDVVKTIYQMYNKSAKEKRIDFLRETKPCMVNIDVNKIKQVLINIMDNALKFTSHGGQIKIRVKKADKYCLVEIIDNGIGIKREELYSVTKMFYKGGTAVKGSGLGLAISKEIIELHGGYIDIESEKDKGTIVRLFIP